MSANVEAKSFVVDGARDSADIFRIAFENDNGSVLTGQLISRSQASGPGSNDHRFENL